MATIVERKQARSKLIAKAKTLIDTAEAANRDFTSDEERRYDELSAKIDAESRAIRAQARAEQLDRDNSGTPAPNPAAQAESEAFLAGEARSLSLDLSGAVRDHRSQRDGLTVGSATGGGHTSPASFVGRLYEHLTASSGIRQTNVTVHTTPDGRDLHVPKTTGHTTAEIVAEGDDIPEDDPEFGQVTLGSWKYGRIIKVSNELLSDSGVDLVDYLARSAGRAIGSAFGEHCITGTGDDQPQGVVTGATIGVTAAGEDTLTADELIQHYFSVIPEYRRNGYWMMNDVTWSKIRQLKDNEDRYLVGGLAAAQGTPQLLGRPVVLDPHMPAPEEGEKPIVFGDFSGYHIRQHQQVRFERSESALFNSDQTVFRVLHRLDARLVDTSGAIKALEMASDD